MTTPPIATHEYRAVPAPRHGVRARGARSPEARFAAALEAEMNRLAAEGWEYVRSDTLPSEERQGLFGGRTTVPRAILVFRRPRAQSAGAAPTMPAAVAMAVPFASRPRAGVTASRVEPPLAAE